MNYDLLIGDCRQRLADLPTGSVQTCITSPPYFGLRDYGHDSQIGSEPTPDEFVGELVKVFREVRRVLADDGTVWLNLGDSYASAAKNRTEAQVSGSSGLSGGKASQVAGAKQPSKIGNGYKEKDLMLLPARVALALQADGWYLRSEIVWHKLNPMPENVSDRPSCCHEKIFLLSKRSTYYYNGEAIKEPSVRPNEGQSWDERKAKGEPMRYGTASAAAVGAGMFATGDTRNKRNLWAVSSQPYAEAHFATYPPDLILPCVLAGSRPGDTVLDPFNGAGTTGLVALENGRHYVGIELNPEYAKLTRKRLARVQMDMFRSQPAAA